MAGSVDKQARCGGVWALLVTSVVVEVVLATIDVWQEMVEMKR